MAFLMGMVDGKMTIKGLRWPLLVMLLLTSVMGWAGITDARLTKPSPSENWLTATTPHFNIHFLARHRDFAEHLAGVAERVHAQLPAKMGLKKTAARKTEIVVNDSVDFVNGGATPVPYNQFFIYMNAPTSGDLLIYDDWIETIFIHEYTHILHLDQAEGAAGFIRKVFGKTSAFPLGFFAFPQAWAPSWVAEGYSVLTESMDGTGRLNNAIYNAKMRQEVMKGLTTFTQASYEGYLGKRWPFGQNYLYGGYFFKFLNQQYGEEKANAYLNEYSSNFLPWRMNARAKKIFNKNAQQLWEEFSDYLNDYYGKEISHIKALGDMPGEIIVDTPLINRNLTAGPDGSVYYRHSNAVSRPEIRQAFPDGTSRKILDGSEVGFMDSHPKAGLLLGKTVICENTKIYTDLFLYLPERKSTRRITECARLPRAIWAADGQSVYAVRVESGKNQLVKVLLGGEIQPITELTSNSVIGGLSASPDGKFLGMSVKRVGSGWNIESLSLPDLQRKKITENNDQNIAPEYSPDGQYLYFISHRDGQVNARRLTLASGEGVTVSNTLGYISKLVAQTDASLWLVEYTGKGEVIRRIPQPQALSESFLVKNTKDRLESESDEDDHRDFSAITLTTQPYNALDTLKPTGWSPVLGVGGRNSVAGVILAGSDVLDFHQWSLFPMHYFGEDGNLLGGSAYYNYRKRLTLLATKTLSYDFQDDIDDADLTDTIPESKKEETHWQALLHYPVNRSHSTLDFAVGAAHEKKQIQGVSITRDEKREDTITGGIISFNNLHHYPLGIGATDGIFLRAIAESYDMLGNSDHSGTAGILHVGAFFDLGKKQTLNTTVSYAQGEGGIAPFVLGDTSVSVSSLGGLTRLGQRAFPLRGYDPAPELVGRNLLKTSVEWHFPLTTIYDGWTTPPVGLGQLNAALFADSGDAWDGDGDSQTFYTGLGVELSTELLIGYDSLRLPIIFGYAEGLDKALGTEVVYLKLGLGF